MKKLIVALCFVVILLLALTVPASASNPFIQYIQYQLGTGHVQYDLDLNNSTTKIGTVEVWDDGTDLHVVYNLTVSGWVMLETHVGVASAATPAAAQAIIGTSPGLFGNTQTYSSPYVTTASYSLPLSNYDLEYGWLEICAHTSVTDGTQQTAWGTGGGTPVPPLPELPAGILLGLGLCGLGGFVLVKRHKRTVAA